MKKILLSLLLVSGLFANEVQIFTANSKRITLDKDTKKEELFCGTVENFQKEQNEIYNSKILKQTVVAASLSAGAVASANGSFSNLNSDGGLIGAGLILTTGAGVIAYNWIVEDNEYIYLSIATNSNHETTILKTLIVSNDKITNEEVKELALKDQSKLLQGNN